MRRFTDYKPLTIDEETALLARCLPQGLAWDAKGDQASNMYLLLRSLSSLPSALSSKLYELVTEWNINNTTDLITEWETAVGIPDECRSRAEDISARRSDVLDKLRKTPVITIADYVTLAETITGETGWDIRPGSEDFPSDPLYKFVLLVSSPVVTAGAFNYPLGSGTQTLGVGELTSSGTTATVSMSDTSSIENGGTVVVSGAVQTEYNGTYTITNVVANTSFDYVFAGSGTTPATGTIVINFGINQTRIDVLAAESPPKYLLTTKVAFPGYPLAGTVRTSVLQCVFRKITPANVALVFN